MSNLLDFHEYTSIFPLMDSTELDKLTDDIKTNGLVEPIWTYEGKIVDGRNRYLACLDADVEPKFKEWNGEGGDLVTFVLSQNLYRRHLNSSQKAMAAAKAKDLQHKLEIKARQRMQLGGGDKKSDDHKSGKAIMPEAIPDAEKAQVRDILADLFDTSPRYVQDAKAILQKAPDLVDLVELGKMSIPKARKEVLRREEATQLERAVTKETGCYDIIYVDLPKNTTYERLEEIGYHVRDVLTHEKSMLFFWCPPANLTDVLSILMHNWQFTYRNCYVWDFIEPIRGKFFNARHDLLLILSKGAAIFPDNPAQFDSIQRIKKTGDKRPEEFLRILEQNYPNLSIIQLDSIIGNIPSIIEDIEPETVDEVDDKVDYELQSYLDKYKDL